MTGVMNPTHDYWSPDHLEALYQQSMIPDDVAAKSIRESVYSEIKNSGWPNKSWPTWRYFDWRSTLKIEIEALVKFEPVDRESLPYLLDAINIVLVDGVLNDSLSELKKLPRGITLCPLSDNNAAFARSLTHLEFKQQPFLQMAVIAATTGFVLSVDKDVECDQDLNFIYVSTSARSKTICHQYNVIEIGENASVKLTEQFVGLSSKNMIDHFFSHFFVGKNAKINYVKLLNEHATNRHLSDSQWCQLADSQVNALCCALAVGQARLNHRVRLLEKGAQANIQALNMTSQQQSVDCHVTVRHLAPHCRSHQLIRSLCADDSVVNISGRIYVAKDASNTHADLQNKNLLLSPNAVVNTQPDLEIYNDDVVCTHGATVGMLDQQAVFYLKTRGLSDHQAVTLLIRAFIASITLDHLSVELHKYIEYLLMDILNDKESNDE
jgi:Fe-S cluster assembly protein SufD